MIPASVFANRVRSHKQFASKVKQRTTRSGPVRCIAAKERAEYVCMLMYCPETVHHRTDVLLLLASWCRVQARVSWWVGFRMRCHVHAMITQAGEETLHTRLYSDHFSLRRCLPRDASLAGNPPLSRCCVDLFSALSLLLLSVSRLDSAGARTNLK